VIMWITVSFSVSTVLHCIDNRCRPMMYMYEDVSKQAFPRNNFFIFLVHCRYNQVKINISVILMCFSLGNMIKRILNAYKI
jgi:hypothetical protein